MNESEKTYESVRKHNVLLLFFSKLQIAIIYYSYI